MCYYQTNALLGTVLLLSLNRNEPLGLRHQPERTSTSSLPSPYPNTCRPSSIHSQLIEKKKTPDGRIILDPQPEDSPNDPLNWSALRRDCALLSLGFYCMLGGGMTTILAAGFNDVASTFNVSYARVALTTGLYMMGLGVGSVLFSPTAILFGKRPTYLASAVIFILTSIWAAKSPNFANQATARVFQGVSVSSVERLPSATIAEIFFLHERAFAWEFIPCFSLEARTSFRWSALLLLKAWNGGGCSGKAMQSIPSILRLTNFQDRGNACWVWAITVVSVRT
jgi:MFS family permease